MRFIVIVIVGMFCSSVSAKEIRKGDRYIVETNFLADVRNSAPGDPTSITLRRGDTFEILEIVDGKLIIDLGAYMPCPGKRIQETALDAADRKACEQERGYFLFGKLYEIPVSSDSFSVIHHIRRWDRVKHGTLLVPFKVSFADATVSTKSVTLGYYIQWPFLTAGGVSHGPIGSAGLASISRSEESNTELGLTIAGGYVWNIQEKFQIGIVVGVDHLGDDTWEYEDKGWLSFMIGFNFLN